LGWPSTQPGWLPRWRILQPEQQAQARARYGIPGEHDILGIFV
jgi:hypothetical protein